MSLKNRVVVITGACGGLGTFMTRELAGHGAKLALLDHDSKKLSSLTNSLLLPKECWLAQTVDLLDLAETKTAANAVSRKFGRIDILLHLVGGWNGGKSIVESQPDDLTFMLNQHIWASFNITHSFIPYLVMNRWGRVVMITSPYASHPIAKGGPYAIGKSGQEALLFTLSQELIGTGVTANLLEVKTIDNNGEKVTTPSPENAFWTTREALASAILYLLGDEAGIVNGAKIPLYGSY
jgi:NAD(P)-dependent dehydrogenase (short-subunit alcohol dehydrogenase family)